MHYSGTLHLARRLAKSHEIPPDSSLPFPRLASVKTPKFIILCYHGIGESGNPLGVAPPANFSNRKCIFFARTIASLPDERAVNCAVA